MVLGEALDRAWNTFLGLFDVESFSRPEIFYVVVLLVVGFVGGKIWGEVVRRILKMTSLDEIGVKTNTQAFLRRLSYKGTLSDFVADVTKWTIYIITIFSIPYVFGSEFVRSYSEVGIGWLWKGLLALLIIMVGGAVSGRLEDIAVRIFRGSRIKGLVDESHAEIPVYRILGRAVKYIGFIVTFLFTLAFLGLETQVIVLLLGIFGLGIVATLVISFRDLTRNIMISVYFQLSRVFWGGEKVRIGEYEGRIEGIRPLYTKLKSEGRTYYIPNTRLLTEVIEQEGE